MSKFRLAIGLAALALASSPVHAAQMKLAAAQAPASDVVYGVFVPLMLGISMMQKDQARRLAIGLAGFFLLTLLLVPVLGSSINGAKRWIDLPGMRFQPSEFLKPAYVVTMAWLLSLKERDAALPVVPLTGAITGIIALLLMQQPDFGQTVIFCACWGALLLLSGVSWRIIGIMSGAAFGLMVLVYMFYENGRQRINDFLGLGVVEDTGPDQVELAHRTITNGGFGGVGPGLRDGLVAGRCRPLHALAAVRACGKSVPEKPG